MNTFGVCKTFGSVKDIEYLKLCESYEDAYKEYFECISEDEHYPLTWDQTFWIVWIQDGRIIQFEQIEKKIKCGYVEI